VSQLQDQLQEASFRGVPFYVEPESGGAPIAVGRRKMVHEYPQRDKPYVEDLGRATRELRITGFVIGLDYIQQASNLIAALEEEGEGTLVHPWLGSMEVSVKDLAQVLYSAKLGKATIDFSFIEAGELEFPDAEDSTPAQSRIAADGINAAVGAQFGSNFNIVGFPNFVSLGATAQLGSVFALMGSAAASPLAVLGYASGAAGAFGAAVGLMSNPLALGSYMLSFFGVQGVISSSMNLLGLARAFIDLAASPVLAAPFVPAPGVYVTPARVQYTENIAQINALTRQALLTQAVGISSEIQTVVYDDAVSVRLALTAALDTESQTAPDDVYLALQAARSAVWRDLTDRARDSARLVTITPPDTVPAIVLAYDRYEDAGRDLEIVARNRLRHPGFVPPVPLQVLTR